MPFYLRTGKRLPRRVTEICIQFKRLPLRLFGRTCDVLEPNVLFLTIQPDERIGLRFLVKYPFSANQLYAVRMDFSYKEVFKTPHHDAYERILLDVVKGDLTLFVREDTIEEMWQVVDPINRRWESQAPPDFPNYRCRLVGSARGRAAHGAGRAGVADHINARQRDVRVFGSAPELFVFTADRFAVASQGAIATRGYFTAALSGGKTPIGLYSEIARLGVALDWKKIHLFLVDERLVPYADSRSNFGMIEKTLLDAVSIPPSNVHPVPVDRPDPAACARSYEDDIRAFFHAPPGVMPRFDLVLLGIGEDGHTASLFPGTPLIAETTRAVGAVAAGEGMTGRVTLTLPVINNAREVVFLVTGKGKAPALRRVVEQRDARLPASLVAPAEGRLSFLSDFDAASGARGTLIAVETGPSRLSRLSPPGSSSPRSLRLPGP